MAAPGAWPSAFLDAVRLFNGGAYFEAHEAFEGLLDAVEADERWDLILALVQTAVGYHKLVAGHPGGARMLGLGLEKLAPFPAVTAGLDVDALRARVRADRDAAEGGADMGARLRDDPPRLRLSAA
jgi:predicted metal-dependent hydrolase